MKNFRGNLLLLLALVGAAGSAHGQIYLTNLAFGYDSIGEYTTGGTTVNATLVSSGLSGPYGLAVSDSYLFVTNITAGTVGVYTTSGAVVNSALISGLNAPTGIVVSGPNLFIAENGAQKISEYTTAGALVNSSLISGFSVPALAISGSNLFVANTTDNTIGVYTTSGQVVNASLVSGLVYPTAVAVSGSELYVADRGTGVDTGHGISYSGTGLIGEYTTAGSVVNAALVTGLSYPGGLALDDSDIFVTNGNGNVGGSVGEYSLSGIVVNASLITDGLNGPNGIVVISAIPEFSSYAAFLGLVALGCGWLRRRRAVRA